MYFPYFRGRQYELLALKELASQKLISSSVIPVIEPVKNIPALNNSLSAFCSASLPIGLIINPSVGDLTNDPQTIYKLLEKYSANATVVPSILINKNAEKEISELNSRRINAEQTLVLLDSPDSLETYQELFHQAPKYTLCPYDRYIRRVVKENGVLFLKISETASILWVDWIEIRRVWC